MSRKFTFLKTGLVGLFLTLGVNGWAQSYDYYTCSAGTITLSGSLNPDDNTPYALYVWTVKDASENIVASQSIANDAAFSYSVPTSGAYTISLQVQDDATCLSKAGTTSLYVLPPFTVDVTADKSAYCEEATGSTLTALANHDGTLPEGVNFEYNWDETNADGSIITTADIATNTNTYVVNKSDPGSYYFVARASYIVSNGTLINANSCETPSAAEGVTVTPLPTIPTITISAN